MTAPFVPFDALGSEPEPEPEPEPGRRGSAWGQAAFAAGLLLIAAAIVTALAAPLALSLSDRTRAAEACPVERDCTTMSLAQVAHDTGYVFPEGTTVVSSVQGTSWFDLGWSMRARLHLPEGAVPDTTAGLPNASARMVAPGVMEVSTFDPDGRPR